MFRLIGVALVAAVGAWLVFRKRPAAAPPVRTRTTIVIGGSGHHPVIVRQPETLAAYRGAELSWEIRNETNQPVAIGLREFKKKDAPPGGRLFPNLDKTVGGGQTGEIRDRVGGNTVRGTYKYDIWIDGALALDPDVIIYEGA